jgi:integrase
MRKSDTPFSNKWIESIRSNPPKKTYSDAGCPGLQIWIADDGTVRFSVRVYERGIRTPHDIGLFNPEEGFGVPEARKAAQRKRFELEDAERSDVVKVPKLEDAIPMYEEARKGGDEQTSRNRAPLPPDWDEHIDRFKRMFVKLMPMPLDRIRREEHILRERNAFATREAKAKGEEMDIRRVRSIFTTCNPMLKWFVKKDWMKPSAIADITPEDYGERSRFLLPGEWQATLPALATLPEEANLFMQFLLATGVRVEAALGMKWPEVKWGYPLIHKAADGTEHEAYIWIIPLDRVKGGKKGAKKAGTNKLSNQPRRVLLVGESVEILKRLRAIYEARKTTRIKDHGLVFGGPVPNLWGTNRSRTQRKIEERAGVFNVVDEAQSEQSWHRHDLRRTHTVYLELMGCPAHLLSLTLMHKTRARQADGHVAPSTSHYTLGLLAQEFLDHDILSELAAWHLRLHKVLTNIAQGIECKDLQLIARRIATGFESETLSSDKVSLATVLERFGLDERLIHIKKAEKLKAVA